jgi:hypothetical protein
MARFGLALTAKTAPLAQGCLRALTKKATKTR